MAVLNLRDVPDELAAHLKSEAALAGISLREYCVGILGCAVAVAKKNREGIEHGVSGAGDVVSKKIADISDGGGAQSSGGTPDLPAVGKAQIEEEMLHGAFSLEDIQEKYKSLRESPGFREPHQAVIYGRPYSGAAPPGLSEEEAKRWNESALMVGAGLGRRELPDGVPCGHAGCLNHLSHPCECCGRIGGHKAQAYLVSAQELKKIAEEGEGGFRSLGLETLTVLLERAQIDVELAKVLHEAGVTLDREILIRWGLAENYKPKLEDVGGVKKSVAESAGGEAGASAGKNRRASKVVPKNDDGDESPAVGVGKPGVNMAALRDICAGNIHANHFAHDPDADSHEVDLCGFKSYNEVDGENYVCGKEKHEYPKVNHGEWIKI